MLPQHQSDIARYSADAKAKLADLSDRLNAEQAEAAEEGRQPRPIVPLTEVDPAVLGPILASIKTVPPELQETHGTLTRVCKRQTGAFAMRSDQLAALLDLAGAKGE